MSLLLALVRASEPPVNPPDVVVGGYSLPLARKVENDTKKTNQANEDALLLVLLL